MTNRWDRTPSVHSSQAAATADTRIASAVQAVHKKRQGARECSPSQGEPWCVQAGLACHMRDDGLDSVEAAADADVGPADRPSAGMLDLALAFAE
eukprot:CAMPEP_0168464862 /NCGR_PEP_ID=MMETSP0228-20121227/55805_1 /TAXON_ID=133427 /ORGANISM="Protoceratium reticulatum, Strain CCCM 535 (=CCMP 1889)" /LENGTH=94 /DNA_ID=CAMNT_0008480393 /DNA_START=146 /DNA_END=429 /DNA_ORIENTATION=+